MAELDKGGLSVKVGCGAGCERAVNLIAPARGWAGKEIVCHFRDIEELFLIRLEAIAAIDEPILPAAGIGARVLNLKPDGQAAAPDRWAEDRQYLRNDAGEAVAAFRRRREETLAHLAALSPEQWRRGGIHPRRVC